VLPQALSLAVGACLPRCMGAFTSRSDALSWKRRPLGGQRCRQGCCAFFGATRFPRLHKPSPAAHSAHN